MYSIEGGLGGHAIKLSCFDTLPLHTLSLFQVQFPLHLYITHSVTPYVCTFSPLLYLVVTMFSGSVGYGHISDAISGCSGILKRILFG